MNSFQETQRQIVISVVSILFVFTVGVIGFTLIERLNPLDALWLTTMTLTTVGYGDIHAQTDVGHVFTIILVLVGFGVVAYGLQAIANFLISPEIRDVRQKARMKNHIRSLENHYIICGNGELVDRTIEYLLKQVENRLAFDDEHVYRPVDDFLDRIFGDDALGHYPRTRAVVRRIFLMIVRPFRSVRTLLDLVVVITEDQEYARRLRANGFLAVEGDPTHDDTLCETGIDRAQALVVMLDNDTEALLTVLTAREYNPNLFITAATLTDDLALKIIRVGANAVIRPFELAGGFLNNVTLRPAVADFFYGVLFDQTDNIQTVQILIWQGSPWAGKRIAHLNMGALFQASVLGIRKISGEYVVAPPDTYLLEEGEYLIVTAPQHFMPALQEASGIHDLQQRPIWQPIPAFQATPNVNQTYTLETAQQSVDEMREHFVICGGDRVTESAIEKLDPTRPFVIIGKSPEEAKSLLNRGFRVIVGDCTQDETLKRAGANRALAVMVSCGEEADNVLTVLACRALSKRLLISVTAQSDSSIRKLKKAGADRVISPFHIAAQVVLLTTTRPFVREFFNHVLYNKVSRLETTELYMEDDSPWIGSTIGSLRLKGTFDAGVIGVRQRNGRFHYAPGETYEIQAHEVLIIVTPMVHADELRLAAHGSSDRRPHTLRRINILEPTIENNRILN